MTIWIKINSIRLLWDYKPGILQVERNASLTGSSFGVKSARKYTCEIYVNPVCFCLYLYLSILFIDCVCIRPASYTTADFWWPISRQVHSVSIYQWKQKRDACFCEFVIFWLKFTQLTIYILSINVLDCVKLKRRKEF